LTMGRTWGGEFGTREKNGDVEWESGAISPIISKTGEVTHYMAVKEDVSEQKRIENELRMATEAANQANQAKSDFLATMSHEIRTPMNGVIGMIGLLLDTGLSTEQQRFAETIRDSGEALLAIINDILDLSKLEAVQLELEDTEFFLEDTVAGVMDIMAPRANAKGLKAGHVLASDIQGVYRGDPGRLRQVLMNLVGNAVKFTQTGAVTIDVSRRGGDHDRPRLRFEVRDTGIGIPEDAFGELFQSFTQVDTSKSRRYGGTGLGLAICKRLVETMGGVIGVESQEGKGTTFWFELALYSIGKSLSFQTETDGVLLQDKCSASQREAPAEPHSARALHLLVAEDNPVNQKVAKAMLGKMGHAVDVVANGIEAVEAVQAKRYDLVFMDIQMPEMDGLHATREIRAFNDERAQVPIVAMTANALKGDEECCLEAGMNGYLSKPINRQKMVELIALLFPPQGDE
ncbi:MAG: ATP-binding protein, partial [Acidobacteriota bacterium]